MWEYMTRTFIQLEDCQAKTKVYLRWKKKDTKTKQGKMKPTLTTKNLWVKPLGEVQVTKRKEDAFWTLKKKKSKGAIYLKIPNQIGNHTRSIQSGLRFDPTQIPCPAFICKDHNLLQKLLYVYPCRKNPVVFFISNYN